MKLILSVFCLLFSCASNADFEYSNAKSFGLSYGVGQGMNSYIFKDYKSAYFSCLGVGIAKEFYEEISKDNSDQQQLSANLLGCGVGVMVSEYFDNNLVNIDVDKDSFMISLQYAF